MSINIGRTLIVGLGGTGVRTLQYIKGEFIRAFNSVPPCVRLLGVDTDLQMYESALEDQLCPLDDTEFIRIGASHVQELIDMSPEIQSWIPPSHKISTRDIVRGAGQRRVSGRLALFSEAPVVYNKLREPIYSLLDISLDLRLMKDFRSLTLPLEDEVNVYIVSSLAGGTGAGILLDIGYMLRSILENFWDHRIIGMFLLPGIFRQVAVATTFIAGNCYAALKEIDYWRHERDEQVIRYPSGFKITWGGPGGVPFDYVYLLDNVNEAGVNVPSLESLLAIIARGILLHMTLETREKPDLWENLSQQLASSLGWKKTVPYMCFGISTLEVPPEAIEEAVSRRTIHLLQKLAEKEANLETDAIQDTVEGFLQTNLLSRDELVNKLLPDIDSEIPSFSDAVGIDKPYRLGPNAFYHRRDSAIESMNIEIDRSIRTRSTVIDKTLEEMREAILHQILDLLRSKNIMHAVEFLKLFRQKLLRERYIMDRLTKQMLLQDSDISLPEVETAFTGLFRKRRIIDLEKRYLGYLEQEKEVRVKAAKAKVTIKFLNELLAHIKQYENNYLPSFEKIVRSATVIAEQELKKVSWKAMYEPFMVRIEGKELLDLDIQSIPDQLDLGTVEVEWRKHPVAQAKIDSRLDGINSKTILAWATLTPEELFEWLKESMKRLLQWPEVDIDNQLQAIWDKKETRSKLREKLQEFINASRPLWRIRRLLDKAPEYLHLFGIPERKHQRESAFKRIMSLPNRGGTSIIGADDQVIQHTYYATTWEQSKLRALTIAGPIPAYLFQVLHDYKQEYLRNEGNPESRITHHVHKDWIGPNELPDLFPSE